MTDRVFTSHRCAALALLNNEQAKITRQAGSFLGQLCVDDTPLSDKQHGWLTTLLDRAGLPSLTERGRS